MPLTYAAAIHTEAAIYVTADSAVTDDPGRSIHDDTFFGEPSERGEYSIRDTALKIFPVCDNRLIAAAGDFSTISRSVTFLKEHSASVDDTFALFKALESSIPLEPRSATLLCAERTDGTLRMGAWTPGAGGYEVPAIPEGKVGPAMAIGSGAKYCGYVTKNINRTLRHFGPDKMHHLMALSSTYHQLVGAHADLGKGYVGGVFVTAAMTLDGVVWQPDITYVLYSGSDIPSPTNTAPRGSTFQPVNILIREDAAFVERRIPEYRGTVLPGIADERELQEIRDRHEGDVADIARNLSCKYLAFLRRDYPCAVLLYRTQPDHPVQFEITNTTLRPGYTEGFRQMLLRKPELPPLQGACHITVQPDGLLSDEE